MLRRFQLDRIPVRLEKGGYWVGEVDLFPTHRMSSSSSKSTLTCGGEEGSAWKATCLRHSSPAPPIQQWGGVLVSASYCPLSLVHWMMVKVQCSAIDVFFFLLFEIKGLCNYYFKVGISPIQRNEHIVHLSLNNDLHAFWFSFVSVCKYVPLSEHIS